MLFLSIVFNFVLDLKEGNDVALMNTPYFVSN